MQFQCFYYIFGVLNIYDHAYVTLKYIKHDSNSHLSGEYVMEIKQENNLSEEELFTHRQIWGRKDQIKIDYFYFYFLISFLLVIKLNLCA